MPVNIDADATNADWTKTTGWDLPLTTDAFIQQVLGGQVEVWLHFKTLPAYEAMPQPLKASVNKYFGTGREQAAQARRTAPKP